MFCVKCTDNNRHTQTHSLVPDAKPPGANTYRGETTCTTPPSDVSLHDLFVSVIILHRWSFCIRVRSFYSGCRSFCSCYRVFLFYIQLFISWLRLLVLLRSPFVLYYVNIIVCSVEMYSFTLSAAHSFKFVLVILITLPVDVTRRITWISSVIKSPLLKGTTIWFWGGGGAGTFWK